MNLNKDIKDLFELCWDIVLGNLKLRSHTLVDLLRLLQGVILPFILCLQAPLVFLEGCLDCFSDLLVFGKLAVDEVAQDLDIHVFAEIEEDLLLKKHVSIAEQSRVGIRRSHSVVTKSLEDCIGA